MAIWLVFCGSMLAKTSGRDIQPRPQRYDEQLSDNAQTRRNAAGLKIDAFEREQYNLPDTLA